MKSIRSLLIFSVLLFCIPGYANAGSAENVLSAIRILSQLGNSDLNGSQGLSKSEAKYFRNSYCSAYELGQDYWLITLKNKLGNDFGTIWHQTVPSLKVICMHWRKFEERKAYRASRNELAAVEKAMRQLERFRLFYVAWRNS